MTKILYEDKYIAVAIKPAGVLSEGEMPDLLAESLGAIRAERGEAPPSAIYPVHRLDKETEGLMIYALDAKAAATLSADISEGRWEKSYRAWLWGVPEKESDTLCDLLYYDRARGKSFVVQRERKGVKAASLEYEVISHHPDGKRTLVKVKLHTGRTHQIRVQFASRRLPLFGDGRYGGIRGTDMALWSYSLEFEHPASGKPMTFKKVPPVDNSPFENFVAAIQNI